MVCRFFKLRIFVKEVKIVIVIVWIVFYFVVGFFLLFLMKVEEIIIGCKCLFKWFGDFEW